MITVHFVSHSGASTTLKAQRGQSVMQVAVGAGLVLAGCGGESHQDLRAARWIGQQIPGLTVWVWPATVAAGGEEDLVRWYDAMLNDLTRAKS